MKIKYTELLIFIVSAELVGAMSAMITEDFDSFFDRYASPPLMPHSWLFSVVWAVLYALMGISAYLIYFSHSRKAQYPLSAVAHFCGVSQYRHGDN